MTEQKAPMPQSQTEVPNPLTREERLEAYGLLAALPGEQGLRGRELGAKLLQDGELDPDTRAILLELEGVRAGLTEVKTTVQEELRANNVTLMKELRASRWWTLWTTTIAMLLVGGLFGIASQVPLPGGGSISIVPSTTRAIEQDDDDATMDDAAMLLDSHLDTGPRAPVPAPSPLTREMP